MEIEDGQVLPFRASWALIRKCDFPYQCMISIQNAEPTLGLMGASEIQRRRDHRSSSIERKAPLSA
jgi:hypothetical protein